MQLLCCVQESFLVGVYRLWLLHAFRPLFSNDPRVFGEGTCVYLWGLRALQPLVLCASAFCSASSKLVASNSCKHKPARQELMR